MLAIDAEEGLVVIGLKGGKRQTLDMSNVADRHIRPAWVSTIHAAQSAACDRVMAHLESFRRDVDAIYTDDRNRLASAIEGRDGTKVDAIDETRVRKRAAIGS